MLGFAEAVLGPKEVGLSHLLCPSEAATCGALYGEGTSREKRALLPLVLSVADFMRKKQWNKLLLLDAPLLLCKYKSTVEEKELDFQFHSAVGSA